MLVDELNGTGSHPHQVQTAPWICSFIKTFYDMICYYLPNWWPLYSEHQQKKTGGWCSLKKYNGGEKTKLKYPRVLEENK